MGTKLASGYIDLSVKYSGAMKQITSDITGLNKTAKSEGGKAGRSYGSSFSSAMRQGVGNASVTGVFSRFSADAKKSGNAAGYVAGRAMGAGVTAGFTAATAGLGLAVAGIGATLFKGFERYKSLDATAKRLGAMGKTGEEVKSIMADINSVVEGTPIALDAASKSATMFLAGGVKQGEGLKKALTAIADASGFSGERFDELAIVFGQVMNKGKLQAEEMLQLNERNIPVQQWLQKELGVTGEELTKMSKDGKLSFQDLINAVESGAGGMAKKMGDSIDGALGNMKTAVARTGANFLAAIFGDPMSTTEGPGGMAQAINNVTEKINGLNNWVVTHKEDIKNFFNDAVGYAKGLMDTVQKIGGFLKEHPGLIKAVVGAFVAWKTISGVAALISNLKAISTLLRVTLPADAAAGSAAMAGSWTKLIPVIGSVWAAWELGKTNPLDPNNNIPLPNGQVAPKVQMGDKIGVDDQGNITVTRPGDDGSGSGRTYSGGGGTFGRDDGAVPPQLKDLYGLSGGGQGAGLNLALNAQRAYGLPAGTSINYGAKGFPSWVYQMASAFGLQASTYSGHQEGSGMNRGIDWSGPVENMQRFAEYLRSVGGMEQVIWNNPSTGQKIGVANGQMVGPGTDQPGYYRSDWGGHSDHVHTRQSSAIPLPPWLQPRPFDTGGWWRNGQLGINTTGEDELVLNPEQLDNLRKQGVDPNTLQHGTGKGALPGPVKGGDGASMPDMLRTEGYIPAAAGHSGKSGNSFLAGLYGMGAEVINGVIDQAASAASTAASAGANAFAPGSGAAAQAGISMGTQAAKRGVQWGADMLGIWTDALIEQVTPFGAPRWISTDPTAFMPSGMTTAVTSSIEAAMQQQLNPNKHQGTGAAPGPLQAGQPVVNPVTGMPAGPGGELDPASAGGVNDYSVNLHGVTVTDVKALTQEAKDQQALQIMRHAGRP
ncbi:tape measure protein [Mycobacterium sp. CnD-18-1]|uniref:tape measure protein n=1 Tax=Mycobacterium sp. CnD-18-1 TaxID=2917744 RepID=UPI001EF26CED|nr:tape measure protein [Mycobacterium sp. CnD-18-1]MCG7610340.1 tape measure protein [Mycobacterium sp. CnD-18-1]